MEKHKEYLLEKLDQNYVNIVITTYITLDGEECEIGKSRISYSNSEIGREAITKTLPERYLLSVMALWGDSPTINKPDMEGIINE